MDEIKAAFPRDPKAPRKLHEPILKGAKGRPITAATAGEVISDGAAKPVELGVMTERKHLRDCRGSFATELMMSGATNEEAAELLGWEEKRIRRIRRKYVNGKAIAGAIVERLETWRKSRDGKA